MCCPSLGHVGGPGDDAGMMLTEVASAPHLLCQLWGFKISVIVANDTYLMLILCPSQN